MGWESLADGGLVGAGALGDEGERAVDEEAEVAELGGRQLAVVLLLVLPEPGEEVLPEGSGGFGGGLLGGEDAGGDGGGVELEEGGAGVLGGEGDGLEADGLGEEAEEEAK